MNKYISSCKLQSSLLVPNHTYKLVKSLVVGDKTMRNNIFVEHIKQNSTIYLFITTLFLIGIIFGAITVNSMSFIQKQDLFFHLDRYFIQIVDEQFVKNSDILQQSFFFHVKYLIFLFILGLTIIGLPLVWLLVFMKGLVIGFSVGFLVNQLGFKGFLYAAIAIAPHNMLIIPLYVTAASLSMIFSLRLIQQLYMRTFSLSFHTMLLRYSVSFISLLLLAFTSSLIETFVANELLKLLLTSTYTISRTGG